MKTLNIWVDCDGVLADFASLYLRLLSNMHGVTRSFDDITSFDFTRCVSTIEQDASIWRRIDTTPGLVEGLRDVEGARFGVQKLRGLGKVRCLTSPHLGPTWMYERAKWLTHRSFDKTDIVFCSAKDLVPGDVLIEDNLKTAEAWKAAHPRGMAILLDAPYNQGDTTALRARDWSDVVKLVWLQVKS